MIFRQHLTVELDGVEIAGVQPCDQVVEHVRADPELGRRPLLVLRPFRQVLFHFVAVLGDLLQRNGLEHRYPFGFDEFVGVFRLVADDRFDLGITGRDVTTQFRSDVLLLRLHRLLQAVG